MPSFTIAGKAECNARTGLYDESAGKKLGFGDLLNKNGGSKTRISVDGKVSVYFEKRIGDDVRFICRVIRKGMAEVTRKSKSLNFIVAEVRKYFPSFPDFEEPKPIPFIPKGIDINVLYRLEYFAKSNNVTSQELCDWLLVHYVAPAKFSDTPIKEFMEVYKSSCLKSGSNFMVKHKYLSKNPNDEAEISIPPKRRSDSAFILRLDAAYALMRYERFGDFAEKPPSFVNGENRRNFVLLAAARHDYLRK